MVLGNIQSLWQGGHSLYDDFKGVFDKTEENEQTLFDDIRNTIWRPIRRSANSLSSGSGVARFVRQTSEILVTGNRTERWQHRQRMRAYSESTGKSVLETLASSIARYPIHLIGGNTFPATPSAPASSSIVEHDCLNISCAGSCRVCSVNERRQQFLSKLGKLFVVLEYVKQERKIKVVIKQYGTVKIEGHNGRKKPNVNIRAKMKFANGHTKATVTKLDCCRTTDELRFNYLTCFECETEEMARKARLDVTLTYKKAFFKRGRVVNKLSMDLSDLQADPEDPEEYLLYGTLEPRHERKKGLRGWCL